MTAELSAVIVPIPEAEAAVGAQRVELDSAAAWGVPAHVTVLFPFVPPGRIDAAVRQRLAAAVSSVPRFTVAFARVAWFGEEVAWLAPDPDDGFRALTAAVSAAFPDHPPYGGAFPDVVPHLTIGARMPPERLRAAARAVQAHLPISATVDAAHLWTGSDAPGGWHSAARLRLG